MQLIGKAPKGILFLSPKALERAVVEAGFDLLEAEDMGKSLPTYFIAARKL